MHSETNKQLQDQLASQNLKLNLVLIIQDDGFKMAAENSKIQNSDCKLNLISLNFNLFHWAMHMQKTRGVPKLYRMWYA